MRNYLDNAATTYPKPAAVYSAVDNYQRRIGVAVGRGAYREAQDAQRIVNRCRQRAAELLQAESSERIIVTFSGTDGLNLGLMGLCRPGDHVVTTQLEHNSVIRPLRWLQDRRQVEVTTLRPDPQGRISPDSLRQALRPTTRLLAVQHASNVTGTVQPIEDLVAVAREFQVLTLVDAAQTAGHWPIQLAELPVDILACPGHKGMLGPLGTGLVYIRPGLERTLECYRLGGTGTQSEDDRQPDELPERYEAGNHNAPGLAGLEAGLSFLQDRGVAAIQKRDLELTERFVCGLREIRGVTVYGHDPGVPHVGVVSITIDGLAPQEAASILDESFGIQVRAGLHCAPGVHRFLGTLDRGGTIRFSIGPFTELQHVDHAVSAVSELARSG